MDQALQLVQQALTLMHVGMESHKEGLRAYKGIIYRLLRSLLSTTSVVYCYSGCDLGIFRGIYVEVHFMTLPLLMPVQRMHGCMQNHFACKFMELKHKHDSEPFQIGGGIWDEPFYVVFTYRQGLKSMQHIIVMRCKSVIVF